MMVVKKVLVVFSFLFSIIINAQNEKLPSYFSNQQNGMIKQLNIDFSNKDQSKAEKNISTISLIQVGDENQANIINKGVGGKHEVSQIGDKNNYQFTNYRGNRFVNLNISQRGDFNSLKIIGSNSIFNNLKITQFKGVKMKVINY